MKFLNIALFIFAMGVFGSCNSDVFIKEFKVSPQEVVLTDVGAEEKIHFTLSDWNVYAMFDSDSSPLPGKLYDDSGELLKGGTWNYIPIYSHFKFVYSGSEISFTLVREEDKALKLTLDRNESSAPFYCTIGMWTESTNSDVYVSITILPKGGER